uniref:Uncharacterized protein n=1 Tax=viral metagenome TaxID=1070528 RepID=A0A6C0BL05_9ZZZZ
MRLLKVTSHSNLESNINVIISIICSDEIQ